jgi:hypothetical protein
MFQLNQGYAEILFAGCIKILFTKTTLFKIVCNSPFGRWDDNRQWAMGNRQ